MSELKISKRYAKALYEFAEEEKIVDKIHADMSLIFETCNANLEFIKFLKSPVIKASKKLKVVHAIFGKEIQKVSENFIRIITAQRREEYLPMIANQFVQLHKEAKGVKVAKIKTAVKLDDNTQKKIISLLENQTGAKIELEQEVNEEILGGFVLSFDNKEIDTSIKTKLIRLNAEFENNPYERKY